jgi:hypothetical protein
LIGIAKKKKEEERLREGRRGERPANWRQTELIDSMTPFGNIKE